MLEQMTDLSALTVLALEREPEGGREWTFVVILLVIFLAAAFGGKK